MSMASDTSPCCRTVTAISRHCERQSDIHAAGVALDGRVQEALYPREFDYFVKFSSNLHPGHSKNSAVQENIFPSCQFRMKPCADLQQTRDPAHNFDPPC